MATETEIQKELAGEREQLTEAVTTLREELAGVAKKAGAAAGALVVTRLVLRLRKRLRS